HPPRAEGQNSWPASVIGFDAFDNPLVLDEEPANLLRLSVARFEHDPTPRTQMVRRLRGQPAIKIQPVRTAVEGKTRVVVAHLRRQSLDVRARNVGGVAHDQIKRQTTRQRGEAIAAMELDFVTEI